jgi:hypothetical protein
MQGLPQMIYDLRKLARREEDETKRIFLNSCAYYMDITKNLIKMCDLALIEKNKETNPCLDSTERGECWAVNENVLGMMEEYLDNLEFFGYIKPEDRHPGK